MAKKDAPAGGKGPLIAIVGLAALGGLAWYLSHKQDADGDGGPGDGDGWTPPGCPAGFDPLIWAEAVATCYGCTLAAIKTRYYAILADQEGPGGLTDAEKAELARLWQNVLNATTDLDKAYCQWVYWSTKSRYLPEDTEAAWNAATWLAEYERLQQQYQDDIEALRQFYETKIATYQTQLGVLEANLGTQTPRTGAVGNFWNTADALAAYQANLDARLASTDRQAVVCTETDAKGTCVGIPWGEFPTLPPLGINNNSIESLTIYKGVKLHCFTKDNFEGTEYTYDATLNSIPFFNLPTSLRNEFGSIICNPSFSDYYRIRDQMAAEAQAAWNTVEILKEQIRSLARDIDLWINDAQLLQLHLTSRQGLIDRINAVLMYVESLVL